MKPIPPFYAKVYDVVSRIPRGHVLTYKEVARRAGSPGAVRAVGMAMKNNPDMSTIPCHRVVASDGSMKGYSGPGGVKGKLNMLEREGVTVHNGRVNLQPRS